MILFTLYLLSKTLFFSLATQTAIVILSVTKWKMQTEVYSVLIFCPYCWTLANFPVNRFFCAVVLFGVDKQATRAKEQQKTGRKSQDALGAALLTFYYWFNKSRFQIIWCKRIYKERIVLKRDKKKFCGQIWMWKNTCSSKWKIDLQ